jgi:hypothetical protein
MGGGLDLAQQGLSPCKKASSFTWRTNIPHQPPNGAGKTRLQTRTMAGLEPAYPTSASEVGCMWLLDGPQPASLPFDGQTHLRCLTTCPPNTPSVSVSGHRLDNHLPWQDLPRVVVLSSSNSSCASPLRLLWRSAPPNNLGKPPLRGWQDPFAYP